MTRAATVAQDGNPSMDDAVTYLDQCVKDGKARGYMAGSAAMGEETLTVLLDSSYFEEIKQALENLKYQVV